MRNIGKFLAVVFAVCFCLATARAADVTPAEMANAFYWNAKDDAGKITSGEWGNAVNWLQQNASVTAAPNGAFDSVAFTGSVGRAYTVNLSQDISVSNLFVHCCMPNRQPQTLLTLDLGGNTLSVTGMVRVGWAWNPYPALTITNGTLDIGTSLCPGFDSNLSSSMARFFAYGSCTTVKTARVTWGMRPEGSYTVTGITVFEIGGGARFETTATPKNAYFTSGLYPNHYRFTGEGTVAKFRGGITINSMGAGRTVVFVADGAKMELDGYYENNDYGQIYRNCIGRVTSGNSLIVDNAVFENNNYPLVIGDLDNWEQNAYNNKLVVTNNGLVVLKDSAAAIYLGRSGHETGEATNNWLHVTDGGAITGLAHIVVGQVGHSTDNHMLVRNGRVDVPYITLGEHYKGYTTNCWLHIEGTSSEIICRAAEGLRIKSGCGLEFNIGAEGYSVTPITLTGGKVSVVTSGSSYVIKPLFPKLRINAEEFARANPKTKVTLISCNKNSAAELMCLATNLTMTASNEIYAGKVFVSADGKQLIYESPAERGTCVIVR